MQPIVYLAGPVTGQTSRGATGWRAQAKSYLHSLGIKAISPVRDAPKLEDGETFAIAYQHEIIGGTPQAIRTKCKTDVMFCDLLFAYMPKPAAGEWPSIGTVIEITRAHSLGKPVILVLEGDEPRLSMHPILMGCVDATFNDLLTGLAYTQSLLRVYVD